MYLVLVRLMNCQSWKDETIEFRPDVVNLIVADNSTGKSVLYKMIIAAANPSYVGTKEERMQLIRHGASFARALFAFSDGSIAMVQVSPERVSYALQMPGETTFTPSATIPQHMIDALGLRVHAKTGTILNVVDMDQDLLLVSSKTQANAALISELFHHDRLAKYLEDSTIPMNELSVALNRLSGNYQYAKNLLDESKKVDTALLEQVYDFGTVLVSVLDNVMKVKDSISSDNFDIACSSKDYTNLLQLANTAVAVSTISEKLNSIEIVPFNEDSLQLLTLAEKVDKMKCLEVVPPAHDYSNEIRFIQIAQKVVRLTEIIKHVTVPKEHSYDEYYRLIEVATAIKKSKSSLEFLKEFKEQDSVLSAEIEQLVLDLKSLGKEIQCPIHGKVVYDGETCVPNNY